MAMSPDASRPAPDGAASRILPNVRHLDAWTPCIELGGLRWPVPPLKGHALEMVRIATAMALPKIRRFIRAASAGDGPACRALLSDDELVGAFLMSVHGALSQAHPTLGRQEFASLGYTIAEIIDSLSTVWLQAGIITQEGDNASQ
jgi:hypothetical protein